MVRAVWIMLVLLVAPARPVFAQIPQQPSTLDTDAAFNFAANAIVDRAPRQRAWAAELIANHHFEALYPKLLTALTVYQPNASGQFEATSDDLAIAVIADAAIRVGLRVPADDARKLYPEFPALAMILLSRPLDDNRAALLSIIHESKVGEVWLTAADLLARHPSPDFVVERLDEFSIFVRFLVFKPGTGGGMDGSCLDRASFEAAEHPLKVPDAWPPVAFYKLTLKNGDAVIANGTNSVSFVRQRAIDPRPWKGSPCSPDIQELRRDLLLQVSGIAGSQTSLQATILRNITRESDEQYLREATRTLEEQARSFADIVTQLRSKELITAAQSTDRRLHMQVVVLRERSAPALPKLPQLEWLGITGEYRQEVF